jgi:NAD(P)-dependent dehydrogenase (short-subunit alcohol dehydrogenase family)
MTTNSSTKITKTGLGGSTAIAGRTVLVTGANRGLGQALVEEALRRGAARVYAGARHPFTHPDERVTPVIMDVTNPAQIQAAAERVESLDILINNGGVSLPDDLSDRGALERHRLFDLEGGVVLAHAVDARAAGARGREDSRGPAGPDRHRHGPGSPDPEGSAGVGRARHLRRRGERGRGDLP